MRKTTAAALLLLAAFFNSCHNEPGKSAVLGTLSYAKKEGPGCNAPEGEPTDCAEINMSWPTVQEGPAALKKSVETWANDFVVGILALGSESLDGKKLSVEEAANLFVKAQKDYVKEVPEAPVRHFTAACKENALLNDGQYLTLEMEGHVYTGGAHGMPLASVATFQVSDGKMLTLNDLFSDTSALKTLLEKAYRAKRPDLFNPTDGSEAFQFDETFPFVLPANYGLVADGLYCHYLHYEVGPYAIGDTQFVVPYADLGSLLKVKRPIQKM